MLSRPDKLLWGVVLCNAKLRLSFLSICLNGEGYREARGNCGFLDFWMKIMEEWVLVCMDG